MSHDMAYYTELHACALLPIAAVNNRAADIATSTTQSDIEDNIEKSLSCLSCDMMSDHTGFKCLVIFAMICLFMNITVSVYDECKK